MVYSRTRSGGKNQWNDMARADSWSPEEDRIVRANAGMMSFRDIASLLPNKRSALAVQLYMHRKGIATRRILPRPIVKMMIDIKFGDASLFTPNRAFYQRVQIGMKRFQDLAKGYTQPTQEEIIRISRALNMQADEMLKLQDATQLYLFD